MDLTRKSCWKRSNSQNTCLFPSLWCVIQRYNPAHNTYATQRSVDCLIRRYPDSLRKREVYRRGRYQRSRKRKSVFLSLGTVSQTPECWIDTRTPELPHIDTKDLAIDRSWWPTRLVRTTRLVRPLSWAEQDNRCLRVAVHVRYIYIYIYRQIEIQITYARGERHQHSASWHDCRRLSFVVTYLPRLSEGVHTTPWDIPEPSDAPPASVPADLLLPTPPRTHLGYMYTHVQCRDIVICGVISPKPMIIVRTGKRPRLRKYIYIYACKHTYIEI